MNMAGFNRSFALFLVAIFATSTLTIVNPVCAQSTPKPSVPVFSVQYVDNSYDVPQSVSPSTNPYTGEATSTIIPGYHVDNKTIELKIMNQPFSSGNDQINHLYYNVRIKGHYAQNWTTVYNPDNGFILQDSNAAYTIITNPPYSLGEDILRGGQVDFQVEAMIGYVSRDGGVMFAPWFFDGQTSGWSNTQTLTIPASESARTQSPSVSPTTSTAIPTAATGAQGPVLFGLGWFEVVVVALLGVVAVLLVLVVVFLRKKSAR
jgi:hypothetical protein